VKDLALRLVPDELWVLVGPLLPPPKLRQQGGGRARADDQKVFTAIVLVLVSGCAWRHLPPCFEVSAPTAHRRFGEWSGAGVWRKLQRAVLDERGRRGQIDWSRVVDAAQARAKKGAP
jgi:transposase